MQVVLAAAVAGGLLVPLLVRFSSGRVDRALTSLALWCFGPFVGMTGQSIERSTRLRSAHVPTTYAVYSSMTLLYAAVLAVALSIAAFLGLYGVFVLLAIDPTAIRGALPARLAPLSGIADLGALSPGQFLILLVPFFLLVGPWIAIATYLLRWWYPAYEANLRERRIDAAMPRTMAFMYAMSKSGMSVPAIMAVLAQHRRVYGAAADEMAVAVRNMEGFGVDMITAITVMGRRSASPRFREFSENLVSVLQSGRDVPSFFRDQYERYQEEAEDYQEQLLTVLAATAEIWVTLLVGGPLFLLTILVVIGITIQDTLPLLALVVYAIVPLVNLAFLVYLGVLFDRIEGPTAADHGARPIGSLGVDAFPAGSVTPRADGGTAPARPTRRPLRHVLANPIDAILTRPLRLFVVTVPLAVGYVTVRVWDRTGTRGVSLEGLDSFVIHAGLFLLVTFAIAYELHSRRLEAIERNVPDLLDRLASVNEAGMTLVASFDRVRDGELGRLNVEIGRIWRDLQWGATLEVALRRFEHRVRTNLVSRVVTLVVMSMRASGEVASVLRIAASQAKTDRRLKRNRQQEMATYVFIAYLGFLVFIIVLGALAAVLLPNLPEVGATVDPGGVGLFGRVGGVDRAGYEQVFFHAVVIQGFFSGLVAGHMSGGDIRNGAKHAAAMVAIGWVVFQVLL